MFKASQKVIIVTGAAFFAASAYSQTPTTSIDLNSGGAQPGNFNLQLLEEVDALRREITELREAVDQQRFEMERLRRENAQSISNVQRELDARMPTSGAGLDGEFSGAAGDPEAGGAFSVGGAGSDESSIEGTGSGLAVGAEPPIGDVDADTEAILSNLYDGSQPPPVQAEGQPATIPTQGDSGETAAFRAEQARFRAEQAELLEAQAQFLQEQARFRQEQARYLEQQAGAVVAPGVGGATGAQPAPPPQAMPGSAAPQIQNSTGPGPGADVYPDPAGISPGSIPGANPSEPGIDSASPGSGAAPSLEMVIVDDDEPARDDSSVQPVSTEEESFNPFDLDAAVNTDPDASVVGGVYSSSLQSEEAQSPVTPVNQSPAVPGSIFVPTDRGSSDDTMATIAPDAIGSGAPDPRVAQFGRPASGNAFGPEAAPDVGNASGDLPFTIEEPAQANTSSASGLVLDTSDVTLATATSQQSRSGTSDRAAFEGRSIVMASTSEDIVLAESSIETYGRSSASAAGQAVNEAPPEPVPEAIEPMEPEPQVVLLQSPDGSTPAQASITTDEQFDPLVAPAEELDAPPKLVSVEESRDASAQAETLGVEEDQDLQVVVLEAPESPPATSVQVAAATNSAPPGPMEAAQEAAASELNTEEARMYNEAFALYQNKKFSKAIKEFKKQLNKYPNGTHAADAHYWSGEALYVTRSMGAAQAHMETILLEYSSSARAPDAMLKLGLIRNSQGQRDDASRIYRELIDRFPGTQAAMAAQNNLASNR